MVYTKLPQKAGSVVAFINLFNPLLRWAGRRASSTLKPHYRRCTTVRCYATVIRPRRDHTQKTTKPPYPTASHRKIDKKTLRLPSLYNIGDSGYQKHSDKCNVLTAIRRDNRWYPCSPPALICYCTAALEPALSKRALDHAGCSGGVIRRRS